MHQPEQPVYTIYDLSSESGVKVSTIRRWTHRKLIPPPASHHPTGVNYTESHMRRVVRIRDWQESQITLDELAERIDVLGDRALETVDPYAGYGWDDDDE